MTGRTVAAALALGLLAGCASGGGGPSAVGQAASAGETAHSRFLQLADEADAVAARTDAALEVWQMAGDTCDPRDPCWATVEGLGQRVRALLDQQEALLLAMERADHEADRAAAARAEAAEAAVEHAEAEAAPAVDWQRVLRGVGGGLQGLEQFGRVMNPQRSSNHRGCSTDPVCAGEFRPDHHAVPVDRPAVTH